MLDESVTKAKVNELVFNLTDKQKLALYTKANEVLYGGAAGGGKLLCVETPIPTPSGWVLMRDIKVGDEVFDELGIPCKVLWVSKEQFDVTYKVTFSDDSYIIAGKDHQWITETLLDRTAKHRLSKDFREKRKEIRKVRGKGKRPDLVLKNKLRKYQYKEIPSLSVKTTQQIKDSLYIKNRLNHSIPVCSPINTNHKELLIPPYVLGAWLGDGTSICGSITGVDKEIFEEIEKCGYVVTNRKNKYNKGILKLLPQIKTLNLYKNKHIPKEYLRASINQRIELLKGLMDTDGTCLPNGQCEFYNTNKKLINDVYELISSLGIKTTIRTGIAKLNGKIYGEKYRLKFQSNIPVFKLKRKLKRQKLSNFRGTHSRRYIVSVKEIDKVPLKCISVSSPSKLYLASKAFIPTHNSYLLRVAAIVWASVIPGLQIYLFRRLLPDLVKTHIEGPSGLRKLLLPWINDGLVEIIEGKGEVRFLFNGSKIYLCHANAEDDVYKYLSAEIHLLLIDELTTFTEFMYRFLRSRNRCIGLKIPDKYLGYFPRILTSSNPGNIGHHWVKNTWLEHTVGEEEKDGVWRASEAEGGMLRQFIRAQIKDNPYLLKDDPGYVQRLKGLGSPSLVKAYLEGSWDIIEGSYFPEITVKHRIIPINIPSHWTRFIGFDWGYSKPFAVLWLATASEDTKTTNVVGEDIIIKKNAVIVYREWIGERDYDKGLRLAPRQIAQGIKSRQNPDEQISYSIADTSIFDEDGGPSIAEQFRADYIQLMRADKRRLPGWSEVRQRLIGDLTNPMLFFFQNCEKTLRDLCGLQVDPKDPEDCLSTGISDHPCDALRYALMSRPYSSSAPIDKSASWLTPFKFKELTVNDAWDILDAQKQNNNAKYFSGLK